MIGGAIGVGRSAARVDATYLLLGLAGLTLVLTSQRHVPIFAACGGPLGGQLVSSLLAGLGAPPRVLRQPSAAAARINLAIRAVLLVAGAAYARDAGSPAAVRPPAPAASPPGRTPH